MTINRQWLLAERPTGMVGLNNFQYAETPIPEPKSDEVLVKNLFLSFDPATLQRLYIGKNLGKQLLKID